MTRGPTTEDDKCILLICSGRCQHGGVEKRIPIDPCYLYFGLRGWSMGPNCKELKDKEDAYPQQ